MHSSVAAHPIERSHAKPPSNIVPTEYALTHSFIHLRGIGEKTEMRFWESGIVSWKRYLDQCSRSLFNEIDDPVGLQLMESINALKTGRVAYFWDRLPARHRWRVYQDYCTEFAFLDIETTGLSAVYDIITVIGVLYRGEVRQFIRNNHFKEFADFIDSAKGLVTFNGTQFDLKFINSQLQGITLPRVHLDLRYLLKRIGYSGGLKKIEKVLGIHRTQETESLSGKEAASLWAEFISGDDDALKRLLIYNAEDIIVLPQLMNIFIDRVAQQTIPQQVRGYFHGAKATQASISVHNIVPKLVQEANIARIAIRENRKKFHDSVLSEVRNKRCVGIDPSGSEKRATGWALLEGETAATRILYSDTEIIDETITAQPDVISIDSPLTLPEGFKRAHDSPENPDAKIMRFCEIELRKRGVSVYPCLIDSMKNLTQRGILLSQEFRKLGYTVIESYPGAAQVVLGLPRKKVSLESLKQGIAQMGFKVSPLSDRLSHDEIDAVTSALVGYYYLADRYEAVGNESEGYIYIPLMQS